MLTESPSRPDHGLQDGEIIQELLQVRDLTLDQTITKCRALEAAKKLRIDIQPSSTIDVIRTPTPANPTGTCPGCGNKF